MDQESLYVSFSIVLTANPMGGWEHMLMHALLLDIRLSSLTTALCHGQSLATKHE